MTLKKLPIVGVMGASEIAHEDLAGPLGRMLAEMGVHLLTGAGDATMAAVCRAFVETEPRQGLCIGIVPATELSRPTVPRAGYPNPWVEVPIYTHLVAKAFDPWDGFSRNHVNVLSSDVVVALPGGVGTAHEVALACTYGKPVAAYFHHLDEMTGLSDSVVQYTALADVRAFVLANLGGR